MADSGGHWKTLAEAAKLTQSMKIPGVYEEDIKRNNPLDRISVAQAAHTGLKIEWLRESTTTEDAVTEIDIGEQLSWSDDIEYTEHEMTLRRVYIQRKLDHYLPGISVYKGDLHPSGERILPQGSVHFFQIFFCHRVPRFG